MLWLNPSSIPSFSILPSPTQHHFLIPTLCALALFLNSTQCVGVWNDQLEQRQPFWTRISEESWPSVPYQPSIVNNSLAKGRTSRAPPLLGFWLTWCCCAHVMCIAVPATVTTVSAWHNILSQFKKAGVSFLEKSSCAVYPCELKRKTISWY